MYRLLDKINKPNDIKNIAPEDYAELAKEIRHFLVSNVSRTGGHLSSNLGTVELTMALHLFLDFPKDRLIFDVGHQAYTHKILTGRKNEFKTLRNFGGLSGFPKLKESECDSFNTGHSSTSISVAEGFVKARTLRHSDEKIVAVIGDGALTGGMAFEALNNASRLRQNLIIILNDNNMSISENVGGLSRYLGKVRTSSSYNDLKFNVEGALSKLPGDSGDIIAERIRRAKRSLKNLMISDMLFEDMGLTYIGPVDGHNIDQILNALEAANGSKTPVLIHAVTKKGKGYKKAEMNPSKFHGIGAFDPVTGDEKCSAGKETYTDVFSRTMLKLAAGNKKLVAITAAMADGTGLDIFRTFYPERFIDVGIAEQHAVTFAAGLAAGGYHPVVAVYSTFLQRAYDQILHDVCISGYPVTFAVDRAGIVGKDGETHQGIFDLSYLCSIPGLTVMAPKNKQEFEKMLEFAISFNGPVAVRYPRGTAFDGLFVYNSEIEYGKSEYLTKDAEKEDYSADIAIVAIGNSVSDAYEAAKLLRDDGSSVTVVNARFAAPLDESVLSDIMKKHKLIVSVEENVKSGGFGEHVASYLIENGYKNKFLNISLPDKFLTHGSREDLTSMLKTDVNGIYEKITKKWLDE